MQNIRNATMALRLRTGNHNIAVRVKQGAYQVVLVTKSAGGHCGVAPLSDWLTMSGAIDFLNAIN